MDSASFTGNSTTYVQYVNRNCKCGTVADIKISNTRQNPRRLFYTCRTRNCDFFQWCNPLSTPQGTSQTIDEEVNNEHINAFAIYTELNQLNMKFKTFEEKLAILWPLTMAISFVVFFYLFSYST